MSTTELWNRHSLRVSVVAIRSNKLWICPLCGKKVGDNLYHLRFVHEIEDIDQFMQVLQKVGEKEEQRRKFAGYVVELQEKMKRGSITAEDFRRLVMEWSRQKE